MSSTETRFANAIAAAAPDPAQLAAWPSLSRAAELIGRNVSVLSRAMDREQVPKRLLGRRDKRVAPVSVLHFARVYGADVDGVADALMKLAEASGANQRYIDSVEQDIGAWMEVRARQATPYEDAPPLETLMEAVRELASPQEAQAIFERAGIMGSGEAGSRPAAPSSPG